MRQTLLHDILTMLNRPCYLSIFQYLCARGTLCPCGKYTADLQGEQEADTYAVISVVPQF